MNKKAISLMISYVILVSIVIAVSIGVYSWLKIVSNVNPTVDCKEGTHIILEDYKCESGTGGELELSMRNNGRFNVNGFILKIGDDPDRAPIYNLKTKSGCAPGITEGYCQFTDKLAPGKTKIVRFYNRYPNDKSLEFSSIEIIEIQPFIVDETGIVICKNSVIKQKIEECEI